jgi:hypothetical protein
MIKYVLERAMLIGLLINQAKKDRVVWGTVKFVGTVFVLIAVCMMLKG